MKKVKLVFWLLVIGLVALVVYQNQSLFLEKRTIAVDLYFKQYATPPFENGILVLACFLAGFLLAYFFSLSERFRNRKTIRQLNESSRSLQETILALKGEVEAIKKRAADAPVESPALDIPGSETGRPPGPETA